MPICLPLTRHHYLYFFIWLWVITYFPSISTWRTPERLHFVQGRPSDNDFFSFFFFFFFFLVWWRTGDILISPSFLKDFLVHIEFLVKFLHSSSPPLSSVLAAKVSDEKSDDNLIEDPLYVTSYFCLAAFKIFSLIMCFGIDLLGLILLGVCWTWICKMIYCIQFGKFPVIIQIFFFPYFLSSPSESPIIHMLVCLMVLHRYLRLFTFLHLFFCLFVSSDLII